MRASPKLLKHYQEGVARTVYLSKSAIAIVNDWIEIRTLRDGPLLCQINKSGRVVHKRLTPQAVLFILHKRGEQAGIKPFSPHDLRRTFICDLLNAGVDISTVQSLAGLSNPATTTRYKYRREDCFANIPVDYLSKYY